MAYKAAYDLLNLINLTIDGKILFLGKTTEETFTIIQSINLGNSEVTISDIQSMDIKESYCQQIFFGSQTPLIINDTRTHPITSKLPLTSELNIRSYLGVPVFYQNGEMYGTLCAIDSKISNFTEKDIKILERFSKLFSYVIELEKRVNLDTLTNLYNRGYLFDNFDYIADKGTLMLLDLDGFKQVNDSYGHDVGDSVLMEIGQRLNKIKQFNIPFRLGGDEFVILFPNLLDNKKIDVAAKQILTTLSNWDSFKYPIDITVSTGIAKFPQDGTELQKVLKHADIAMYRSKQRGKNSYMYYE